MNTLYNLQIYIERFKILHVFTYKWKYFNIVKSNIFFLSEIGEMKGCIYRAKTKNTGMGL